jgi:hypothetical protein
LGTALQEWNFWGEHVNIFLYNDQIYFVPAYRKDRVVSGLQLSTDPLSNDDELMKSFALLEIGWFDCYEEISKYIEYLLEVCPASAVRDSFLRRGIPSRDQIMFAWAGLHSY